MLIFPKVSYVNNEKTDFFPVIYVANHVSMFDLFLSGAVLHGFPRGYELAKHFDKPFYGWFITFFDQIPLDPTNKTSVMKSLRKGDEVLKNRERSLFFMPEGSRTRTGELGDFNNGAFCLSFLSGIPIVPVIYKDLFLRNNPTSLLINPGRVNVIIGEPISPHDFKTKEEMSSFVRDYIKNKIKE